MAIFTVIPLGTNRPKIEQSVKALPADDVFTLPGDAGWFVKFSGTSQELTVRLGVPKTKEEHGKEPIPTVLVMVLTNYWGFASRDMWEWVNSRSEG